MIIHNNNNNELNAIQHKGIWTNTMKNEIKEINDIFKLINKLVIGVKLF